MRKFFCACLAFASLAFIAQLGGCTQSKFLGEVLGKVLSKVLACYVEKAADTHAFRLFAFALSCEGQWCQNPRTRCSPNSLTVAGASSGFSTEETHRMRSATKAVLPRTFRLIGPQLDSRAAKAGAIQMQASILMPAGQSTRVLALKPDFQCYGLRLKCRGHSAQSPTAYNSSTA